MANDYYVEAFAGVSHGLARVQQVVDSLNAVEAGFAKLPALRALLEDRVTAVVATTTNGQAFVATMTSPPTAYTDGMALNVRFPQISEANPTLDLLNPDGVALGAKPIRDVNGNALGAGHISAHVRAELYYVDQGTGYWILGAGGARGPAGPAGPPAGEFYIIAGTTQLGFRTTGGTPVHNFGQVAFKFEGTYNAATTYQFLDVVADASNVLHWHHGLTATTGTATTDTTVWQPLVPGLAAVATSGAYSDLSGRPALGALAARDALQNDSVTPGMLVADSAAEKTAMRTRIGAGTSNFDGAYSSLTGAPAAGLTFNTAVSPNIDFTTAWEYKATGFTGWSTKTIIWCTLGAETSGSAQKGAAFGIFVADLLAITAATAGDTADDATNALQIKVLDPSGSPADVNVYRFGRTTANEMLVAGQVIAEDAYPFRAVAL